MQVGGGRRSTGAVVVGGGHNGLICATYLARAGIAVTVVEARSSVGGNASSETVLGGARVNICNCDHTMIRSTPIFEELGLASHGLQYIDSHLSQVNVHWDGSPAWYLFHDVERTIEGLRSSAPQAVDGYRRYVRSALPIARFMLEIANSSPTPGAVLSRAVRRPHAGATLLRWSRKSVADVMRTYFSDEQMLGPAITTGPVVWGLPPELPGTGLGAITYALRHAVLSGRPVGGSGALPQALERAFIAAGGTVVTNTRVSQILCEGDVVVGVRTDQGDIEAPIVVCAADARTALVEWLRDAPPQATSTVARYRAKAPEDGYESKVDAVIDSRFRYRSAQDSTLDALGISHADAQHATTIVSVPLADMVRAFELKRRGEIADRPMFYSNTPSVKDSSVAAGLPAGRDVFSLEVLWTPYALARGWDGSGEPQRWLQRFGDLVEMESGGGFVEAVKDWRLMGPEQYQEQFLMARGFAPAFSGTPLSALIGRDPELTRYETPVRGLFLTGASTFPGAGIWGASGRNAATAILRSDRRRGTRRGDLV